MDTLVVGAGEMGRWFADCVDHDDLAFLDADPAVAEAAAEAAGGRVIHPDDEETFDLVCVAVPLPEATAVIEAQAHRAERAICDVSGVMAGPVGAMREHAPDVERLSLHPLFSAAREPGNVAVVHDEPGPLTNRVRDRMVTRGNRVFETTPEEHDEAMETVQARAHAAVLAYALATEDVPDRFHTPVSRELAALVDQVTGGEARVYGDIQEAFDGADAVAEAARTIADADGEAFADIYEQLS